MGDSQADGKWPRLVENTRPSPSEKHHDSGYPKEGGRVLIYGMRYKAYLPNYYLGVAHLNLGNCDAARTPYG